MFSEAGADLDASIGVLLGVAAIISETVYLYSGDVMDRSADPLACGLRCTGDPDGRSSDDFAPAMLSGCCLTRRKARVAIIASVPMRYGPGLSTIGPRSRDPSGSGRIQRRLTCAF
ncbi:hypothetical protein QMTAC487_26010 [Sphaerotilus sp. FB-3]|nr:hypothetical protein QMTAC487_26010 [Sphaerotilus sp. FB-3]